MPTLIRFANCSLLALIALLGLLSGCSSEPEIPRVKEEIIAEILALPSLYRTASGKEVEAPKDASDGGMMLVDPASGELAWRVWECHNPDCPGKTGQGPHLFICPLPGYSAAPDGTIAYPSGPPSGPAVYCPACMETRNYASESLEEIQRYSDFITVHELPSSVARKLELEAELRTRIDYVNEKLGINESSE